MPQHTKDGLKDNKEAFCCGLMLRTEKRAGERCDNAICTLKWTDRITDVVWSRGKLLVVCKYVLLYLGSDSVTSKQIFHRYSLGVGVFSLMPVFSYQYCCPICRLSWLQCSWSTCGTVQETGGRQ